MLRISVVLPQPDGPSRPVIWPAAIEAVRPGMTVTAPAYDVEIVDLDGLRRIRHVTNLSPSRGAAG